MEFKNSTASFDVRPKFSDSMKRFVCEEAARFTMDHNEAASASVDEKFEQAMRFSAGVSKGKAKEAKKKSIFLEENEMNHSDESFKSIHQSKTKESSKESFRSSSDQIYEKDGKSDYKSFGVVKNQADGKPDSSEGVKALKKEASKEQRKAATKTAVANMFQAKKELSNQLSSDKVTGDAFKDGNTGFMKVMTEYLNPMHYVKKLSAKIGAAILPYILGFMTVGAVAVVVISLMFSILQPMAEVGEALSTFIGVFTGDGGGLRNTSFSDGEIDEIIADSGADETQEKVIRFALSKVGYPYSQDLRTSGSAYDCSSLAYYSWENAGVDISYGTKYPPTAAEGARMLEADGKALSVMDLKPGDLIYYGGEANGRYKGIYHVAIYVGNGKAVEALSTKYGVVYQTLRTKNAIMVARPNM